MNLKIKAEAMRHPEPLFTSAELYHLQREADYARTRSNEMRAPVDQVRRLILAARISMPPVPELAGKFVAVVYFETAAEADDFFATVKKLNPRLKQL